MGMNGSILARRDDASELEVWVAVGGFLAGYSGHTRLAYHQDLRKFIAWCHDRHATYIVATFVAGAAR